MIVKMSQHHNTAYAIFGAPIKPNIIKEIIECVPLPHRFLLQKILSINRRSSTNVSQFNNPFVYPNLNLAIKIDSQLKIMQSY